jgi:ABC-type multidrug transport system ATPase subunit
MRISLTDAGKRYNREWVFRHFDQEFHTGQSYAITGPNGSGKSTLLQVIAGSTALSEGKMVMENVKDEEHYQDVSIAAPYLELIEEMSGLEFLQFHGGFKPFVNNMNAVEVLERFQMTHAANKQIRYYSSGMKQRLKLAQCILSQSRFLLLDEPCTNLDETGIALYLSLIEEYGKERCVIVSSNDKVEYSFCKNRIDIVQFKSQDRG